MLLTGLLAVCVCVCVCENPVAWLKCSLDAVTFGLRLSDVLIPLVFYFLALIAEPVS